MDHDDTATVCLCACPEYRHYGGGSCSTGGCGCRRFRRGILHGPPPPPATPPASHPSPAPRPSPEPAAELPPDVLPELPADAAPSKRCPNCDEAKPLTEFYQRQRNGRTQPQGWCISCQKASSTARPTTVTVPKLLRNRARHRAVAALVSMHQHDFEVLYEAAKAEVAAEAAQIAAVPAAAEHYGDQPIRLRPGPRLPAEEVIDRIDVGRCPDCARHHDAGHACPACGATPADLGTDTLTDRTIGMMSEQDLHTAIGQWLYGVQPGQDDRPATFAELVATWRERGGPQWEHKYRTDPSFHAVLDAATAHSAQLEAGTRAAVRRAGRPVAAPPHHGPRPPRLPGRARQGVAPSLLGAA